jgi:DNA-binding response OmpR family regulator
MKIAMASIVIATRRVLVVDDEPNVREVLIQRLRHRNFDVEGAANGNEALARMGVVPFDVVVLDLLMPASAGTDVLRALGDATTPRVIVLSGLAELWNRHHPGATPFAVLQKPVEMSKLLAAIDAAAGAAPS